MEPSCVARSETQKVDPSSINLPVPVYGYVYKYRNIVTNQCYIGVSTDINRRDEEHLRKALRGVRSKFYNSMAKYGRDNFDLTIICTAISRRDMLIKEKFEILKNNSHFTTGGLNMTWGGDGCSEIQSLRLANKEIGQRDEIKKGRSERAKKQWQSGNLVSYTKRFTREQMEAHFKKASLTRQKKYTREMKKLIIDLRWLGVSVQKISRIFPKFYPEQGLLDRRAANRMISESPGVLSRPLVITKRKSNRPPKKREFFDQEELKVLRKLRKENLTYDQIRERFYDLSGRLIKSNATIRKYCS